MPYNYVSEIDVKKTFLETINTFRSFRTAWQETVPIDPLKLVLVETRLAYWGISSGTANGHFNLAYEVRQKIIEILLHIRWELSDSKNWIDRGGGMTATSKDKKTTPLDISDDLKYLHDRIRSCSRVRMGPEFRKAHRGLTWAIKDRGRFDDMVHHVHVHIDALFAIPTILDADLTLLRDRILEGAQRLYKADVQTMLIGATPR
jgi:hypothetical protein